MTIFFTILIGIAGLFCGGYCFALWHRFIDPYKRSSYARETQLSWLKVLLDKGRMGEFKVSQVFETIPGCRKLLYNVYVPLGKIYQDASGSTREAFTEIDVLMIHERGIFVFESKRYNGWIFGNDNQKYWTVVYQGGLKKRFLSPLIQNENHMEALKEWLGNRYNLNYEKTPVPFFNVVVFSGQTELKQVNVDEKKWRVVTVKDLARVYAEIIENPCNKRIFKPEEVVVLYRDIKKLTVLTPEQKLAHIERVKQVLLENQ